MKIKARLVSGFTGAVLMLSAVQLSSFSAFAAEEEDSFTQGKMAAHLGPDENTELDCRHDTRTEAPLFWFRLFCFPCCDYLIPRICVLFNKQYRAVLLLMRQKCDKVLLMRQSNENQSRNDF